MSSIMIYNDAVKDGFKRFHLTDREWDIFEYFIGRAPRRLLQALVKICNSNKSEYALFKISEMGSMIYVTRSAYQRSAIILEDLALIERGSRGRGIKKHSRCVLMRNTMDALKEAIKWAKTNKLVMYGRVSPHKLDFRLKLLEFQLEKKESI